MNRSKTARIAFAAMCLGTAVLAHGDIAFTNLQAPPFPYGNTDHLLWKFLDSSPGTLGFRFTSQSSGLVTGLSLAINNVSAGAPISYTASFYRDSSNELGDQLISFNGQSTGHVNGDKLLSEVNTFIGTGLLIDANTDYWLVVTGQYGATWAFAQGQPTGRGVGNGFYSDFYTQGAFEVRTQAVPEPATLSAIAFGLLALRRKRKA
jgi:hypothetical protein